MDQMDKEKDQIFLDNNDTVWNFNHILWDRTFFNQFSEVIAM